MIYAIGFRLFGVELAVEVYRTLHMPLVTLSRPRSGEWVLDIAWFSCMFTNLHLWDKNERGNFPQRAKK